MITKTCPLHEAPTSVVKQRKEDDFGNFDFGAVSGCRDAGLPLAVSDRAIHVETNFPDWHSIIISMLTV